MAGVCATRSSRVHPQSAEPSDLPQPILQLIVATLIALFFPRTIPLPGVLRSCVEGERN